MAVNISAPPRFRLDFSPGSEVILRDSDQPGRMALVDLQEPSTESRLYLIGQDDALFSQRLGQIMFGEERLKTVRTVGDALELLTPEAVRSAQKNGAKVLRQGDIWFIPLEAGDEGCILGTRHMAERIAMSHVPLVQGWIRHPEHKPLFLDRPHWAYANLAVD